jgi:hypothetical protein
MSKCKTYKYGGVGTCNALRQKVRAIMLTDKGTTITLANAKLAGAVDTSGWCAILAPIIATQTYEKGVLIDMCRGVEVTTAAPEMATSNLGFTEQVGPQMPRMTGYGDMSYAEYISFFRAHGKTFDIVIVLDNGDLLMTPSGTSYKGFRGRIFVTQGSIPKVGADLIKECFFDIIFDDPEEWEKITEIDTNFTFTELKDLCPVGLDVVVTTAYSTPTVTFKVTLRNSDTPYALVATGGEDLQIVESVNDAACAVTSIVVTNAAIGSYVATITASLNGPCWARISDETASKRTYASPMFEIVT